MPAIELSVESRDVGAKTGANAEEWLDVDESRYTCGFSCSGSGGVLLAAEIEIRLLLLPK